MHNSGHFLPGWVVACESRPDQALSAPCSRGRLTHNDIVATAYLSMSKDLCLWRRDRVSAPVCCPLAPMLSLPHPYCLTALALRVCRKEGVCKVFVAHFPGRRALAGERDGLVLRLYSPWKVGAPSDGLERSTFLQVILVAVTTPSTGFCVG